jgi:peroxiredoxin
MMEHEQAQKMKKTVNPEFEITVDEEGKFVDLLGIRHKNANPIQGVDLPQAASFLFDSNGKVIWLHLSENYRVRPDPTESLDAAKSYFSANVAP